MDKKTALENVRKYLDFLKENNYIVKKAYIFGSYAKGSFNDDSDIDVAVILNDVKNSFLLQIELMKLSSRIDSRIEPHPFDILDFKKSNPFVSEIISNGIQNE